MVRKMFFSYAKASHQCLSVSWKSLIAVFLYYCNGHFEANRAAEVIERFFIFNEGNIGF